MVREKIRTGLVLGMSSAAGSSTYSRQQSQVQLSATSVAAGLKTARDSNAGPGKENMAPRAKNQFTPQLTAKATTTSLCRLDTTFHEEAVLTEVFRKRSLEGVCTLKIAR